MWYDVNLKLRMPELNFKFDRIGFGWNCGKQCKGELQKVVFTSYDNPS